MQRSGRRAARLVGVFLLGCLLFNYPMITLFNVRSTIFGVPILYAYLFSAWALVIVLVGVVMERRE